MKKTLLAIAATLTFGYANAQLKVGSNPTTVNTALNLEVEATNGTKLAVDKATGKVGIGTTTPTDMLTVRNSTAQPAVMVSNGGNAAFSALIGVKHEGVRNGYLGIDPASKNLFLLNYGSGTLDQGNNTNLKSSLVLTDNGAVGIGTVTPLTRLHVNNGFTSGLTSTFSNAALTLTGSSLPRIYWENPTNTTGQRVMSAGLTTAGALNFDALSDNAGTVLTPSILTLTNSGKVGIGTSTPTDMLSVRNSTIQPIATVSNGANIANTPLIGVKDEGVRNAYLGVDPTSHSLFLLNYGSGSLDMGNNGVFKSSLVMTDDGKVGIGTTSPTAKLDVAGTARVQTTAENATSIKTVKLATDGTLGYAYQVSAFPTINSSAQDDPIGTTGTFTGTINGNAMTYTMTNKGTSNGGYVAYYDVVIAGTGFGFVPSFVQITPAPSYIGDFLIANVVGGTITATTFQMKIRRLDASTPWSAPTPIGILAIKQ